MPGPLQNLRLLALCALVPACRCDGGPGLAPPIAAPTTVRVVSEITLQPSVGCDAAGYGTLVFSLRNNETQAEGFSCFVCPASDGNAHFHFDEALQPAENPGPYNMAFNYDAIAGEAGSPVELLFAGSGHDRISYPPTCGQPCTPPNLPPCGAAFGVPPRPLPTGLPPASKP